MGFKLTNKIWKKERGSEKMRFKLTNKIGRKKENIGRIANRVSPKFKVASQEDEKVDEWATRVKSDGRIGSWKWGPLSQ